MKLLVVCFLISTLSVNPILSQCLKSETTASGTHAPKDFCSGDLIFEDNFDTLNFGKWKHEVTMGGGGNWEFQMVRKISTTRYLYLKLTIYDLHLISM
jgi:hypothetical protein